MRVFLYRAPCRQAEFDRSIAELPDRVVAAARMTYIGDAVSLAYRQVCLWALRQLPQQRATETRIGIPLASLLSYIKAQTTWEC